MWNSHSGIIGPMPTLKRLAIVFLAVALSSCSGGLNLFASPTPVPPTFTPLPPTGTPVPVALSVNGEGITIDEFDAELARYKAAQAALGNHPSDQDAAGPVIDEFVSELLLAQGARKDGFSPDDAAMQSRIDALATSLGGADKLSAWEQAHGYSETGFRQALKRSVSAAWMRDKIISGVPASADQVHVRQILLYNQDTARSIMGQLQGGSDFDTLAAAVDPVTHGDIGWFPKGYLSEKPVEDAAFALEPGKYSDVIQDPIGFHILKLLERQAGRPLSPDELLTLQNRAVEDWVANTRKQSSVVLAPK
jgi:parvulin-like peptidyl-prolyl isomerase